MKKNKPFKENEEQKAEAEREWKKQGKPENVHVVCVDETKDSQRAFKFALRNLPPDHRLVLTHGLYEGLLGHNRADEARLRRVRNFIDRVALKYIINPLDEAETGEMIQFRLRSAGLPVDRTLFSPAAVQAIYRFTLGYPRKISLLCHNALETLVMQEQTLVDAPLLEGLIRDESRWLHETIA